MRLRSHANLHDLAHPGTTLIPAEVEMAKYQIMVDLDEGKTQVFKLLDNKKMILLKEFPTRKEADAYIESLPRNDKEKVD